MTHSMRTKKYKVIMELMIKLELTIKNVQLQIKAQNNARFCLPP